MRCNVYWGSEDDLLELGSRFRSVSDEGSALEHRMAKAFGYTYGSPPRHWTWGLIK